MNQITADTTSLNEFGLTPELILQGERAEFDPEAKPNPKKATYVRYDFAMKLIDAYADDLLQAYRKIDELEMQIVELGDENEKTTEAANKAAGQVKDMLKSEQEFADAEKLLAKFEQQLEQLAQDKEMDKSTIEKLQVEVNELVELRDTVPQLEQDVNNVLANLKTYFDEEGIVLPDVDDDDDATDSTRKDHAGTDRTGSSTRRNRAGANRAVFWEGCERDGACGATVF